MLKKNELVTLDIRSLSSDGNGIGAHDGIAIFVPFSAVGDRLLVRIVSVKKSYAFGRIEEILVPSPDRVEPDCEVYGRCGGCVWRHISREAELTAKRNIVADALSRIGHIDIAVPPVAHAGELNRYRNKVQFPIAARDGRAVHGLYAPRSHRVVPVGDCRLQSELLNAIAACAVSLLNEYSIPPYDELRGDGLVRHIFLRASSDEARVMLVFVINGRELPHFEQIAERLTARFANIVSLGININRERTNAILGRETRILRGSETIDDTLCGVPLSLSANSFYQVNHAAAELLYSLAADCVEDGDSLLDLYCGAGSIGLSMAKKVRSLVGVDIEPSAIENAEAAAKRMGADNARFYCGDAERVVKQIVDGGEAFDTVITDPPRKGCSRETLSLICSIAPKRIVMISCNPATLARDLSALIENGYTLRSVQPVDMFPRTSHIEVVACLTQQ